MELIIGINSYMGLDEANTIINDELFDSDTEYKTWNSLSEENKKKLIVKGTRLVDQLPFIGYKSNLEDLEVLHWPRIINNKEIECPLSIKLGLLKQMLRDFENRDKQETKLQELGVKEYSIKNASIKFSDTNSNKLSNGVYRDIYEECFSRWTY